MGARSPRLLWLIVGAAVVAAVLFWLFRGSPTTPRRPVQVVLALDVSTSMRCPVEGGVLPRCPVQGTIPPFPGDAFIDAAVRQAVPGLGFFKTRDRIAVWTFGAAILGGAPKPLEDPGELAQNLTVDVRRSGVFGATPLYEAVYRGVRVLRAAWRPEAVNALVLLSDGTEQGSTLQGGPLTARMLKAELGRESDKPIHVLLTAADQAVCNQLARSIAELGSDDNCHPIRDADGDERPAVEELLERLEQLARE